MQENDDDGGCYPCEQLPPPKPEDDDNNNSGSPLGNMNPGDIITLDVITDGQSLTLNYMLGLMDDEKTLGFWDLDAHAFVPYAIVATTVDMASSWTTFRKIDPKTFNSYEMMATYGTPFSNPSYDVNWTGGMDDGPGYVEIHTEVDWANAPGHFFNAVLGPALVTAFWQDAKPTITPLSQAGYFPLTNYVIGLAYFATDGAAISRYPIIHP